jgi:hypothetical protein
MNILPSIRIVPGVVRLFALLLLCNLAHGTTHHFTTVLSGAIEVPVNASPGTGTVHVYYNDVAQTMRVVASFSGLLGTSTVAHIHGPTAVANTGVAAVATQTPTFGGFPVGVFAGSYDMVFDMTLASSFRAGFITANGGTAASASAALLTAMMAEKTYFNLHTVVYPGGEIRGFLHRPVPDTGATLLLLTISLGALAGVARRQKLQA